MDSADFVRIFAYDRWANREALKTVAEAAGTSARPLRLFSHIVGAQSVWLDRLLARSKAIAVWPERSVEECRAQLDRLDAEWQAYLASLTVEKLRSHLAYKNSKGEPHTDTVEQILLHVTFHGSYHRGQIAQEVRAAGHTPVDTDFIYGVWNRSIE